jgi:proteasome lid subunit RPN8/RPN11
MTTEQELGARPRLLVARSALAQATDAAAAAGRTETGGVLLGFRAGSDVWVTDALVVPADVATGTRYVSTETARDAAIARFQQKHPHDKIGYVGTWHSHPGASRASPIDKRTLRSEAADAPDLVAMLIVLRSRRGWQTEAYIGHHHRTMEYRRRHRIIRRDPWITPARVISVDS